MYTVPANELSKASLLKLLEDAGIEAQPGDDDVPDFVEAKIGEFTFIIEPYAEAQIVRAWTAMELEPGSFSYENFLEDTNRFNSSFLLVRNFLVRDPDNEENMRVVWDHDRVIGSEGLSSEVLASILSRVATVIMQAFAGEEGGEA